MYLMTHSIHFIYSLASDGHAISYFSFRCGGEFSLNHSDNMQCRKKTAQNPHQLILVQILLTVQKVDYPSRDLPSTQEPTFLSAAEDPGMWGHKPEIRMLKGMLLANTTRDMTHFHITLITYLSSPRPLQN